MLIEASLLPRNLSSVSVRTCEFPYYYGYGSGTVTLNGTVINYCSDSAMAKSYGSYGSGSATLHSAERLV
jgi:hypothetical protein